MACLTAIPPICWYDKNGLRRCHSRARVIAPPHRGPEMEKNGFAVCDRLPLHTPLPEDRPRFLWDGR